MSHSGAWTVLFELCSHQINAGAVRYEVEVSLEAGIIVCVARLYLAERYSGSRIYRDALKDGIIPVERVIVDNGYEEPTPLFQ